MTPFQNKCNRALIELMSPSIHSFLEKSFVFGREENYVEGKILDFKFWIYEDGAEIQGEGEDHRLEKEDFDSLEELQKEFISIFKRLLTSPKT